MKPVKDRLGRMIGWTEKHSNGMTYIHSTKKGMLGWYDPHADWTYKVGGGVFGYGNQLMSLLT